uniref:RING-type domain-containing protein n=1 Tax=Caenorhabditis tropicalis TaxID=1561998 RepID=A0A1I7TBS4_9PELO
MDGEVPTTSRGADDVTNRIPSHFLVELTSLDELAFPAKSTKRVKYTCVASTSKCLCLGTSTGSVYIFSRYAAKSRSRASSPVPVQVFTTRDGQISTISVSPSEELMAIGGDSGRVSIAQLNNGQPPTLVYSTPGDARSPDRVTALSWSPDLKTVYSGHSSGSLHCHRLTSRSVFRAAHQKLTKFDGEIVQLDTLQSHVLVATSLAAHLFDVDKGTLQSVGEKLRSTHAPLGACYVQDSDTSGSAFIIAARPNGRLWEANLVGVVYKTHQYRQCAQIPRAPPISFRSPFPIDPSEFEGLHPKNQDVSLHKIHVIRIENGRLFVVSTSGSRICVVEMETSSVIVVAELEHEILDVSTCANDVFVLLADSKGLRKFSVFERAKSVEKLNLKGFFGQSAQSILFCTPHFQFPTPLIQKTIEGLATMSRKKETERLQTTLQKILDDRKASQSMYDNMGELERRESLKVKKKEEEIIEEEVIVSKKMASGVHRVLQTVQCSGYDDDFSFATPQALRERSRSSPCGPDTPISPPIEKRASEPSSLELEFWRKNGTPDVAEEDILHRARQILEDSEKLMEKESLRTLLQLEGVKKDEIRFTPTVTIGNAAKALAELALAVPVDLSTIWNRKVEEEEVKTTSKKPTIVKVVRPGVRSQPLKKEKPVATVSPRSATDDVDDLEVNNVMPISEEMRRKQDEMWLDLRLSHIKKQSQPPETVPKSDTDYTLTTESSGTPSGVWTNPLDEEETPTTSTASSTLELNCATCGMHRSWAATSLLMAVCSGAEVLKDEFRRHGAIPQSHVDWSRLLCHVAEKTEDLTAICPRCEMSLSSVERVCVEGWRTTCGMVEDGVRPNYERIFERCINSSREKLETIISGETNARIEQKASPTFEFYETKIKPTLGSEVEITEQNDPIPPPPSSMKLDPATSGFLRWIQAVPMKTIIALAVFTIGKKAVLDIISENDKWIARKLKPADWCSIVVMGTRETVLKDLLSAKTIISVLDSVGCSGWVAPRKKKLSRRMSPVTNATPITSWIVDTNGKCPMCTLPIKMIVGGTDRGVVSYFCGHVFHKMCLAGRFTSGCIACRVKARRAARTGSSATSSPTASPIMSPRHQRLG